MRFKTANFDPKAFLLQSQLTKLGYPSPEHPLSLDGIWGPKTESAYQAWLEATYPSILTPASYFPKDKTETLNEYYGTPDFQRGIAPKTVYIDLPFTMRLAWAQKVEVNKISCNNLVASSLSKIFEQILDYYGVDGIKENKLDQYGGCINVRKTRRGNFYSRHSWGIAIDINPSENGLRTPWEDGKQGIRGFATMPTKVIEIFEANGWLSGARAWGDDAMHFQATQ